MENVQQEPFEKLVEAVHTSDYGTFFSYQEIVQIIGINKNSNKFRSTIEKANMVLLNRGKMLKCRQGEGYNVLNPDGYLDEATKHSKKAVKQMKKTHEILLKAPRELMSIENKDKVTTMCDRAGTLYAAMSGGNVELTLISRPKLLVRVGKE